MEEYKEQFTLRVPENTSKIDRILKVYKEEGPGVPDILYKILEEQKSRLGKLKDEKGEYISPTDF